MSIWTKDGLSHITPKGLENPEGFDVKALLKSIVKDGTVLDYGCGRGRLSDAFDPDQYLGYDINKAALLQACNDNQAHFYTDTLQTDGIDYTLFYTVLLHIEDIGPVLDSIESRYIIIGEIMNERLARPKGTPPAFNRSEEYYETMMQSLGYRQTGRFIFPYEHYNGEPFTIQVFER